MQAFLRADIDIVGDGTSTSFVFDLNAVFVFVTNGVGGSSLSSVLPNLFPDVLVGATVSINGIPTPISATLNKNKVTLSFPSPLAPGSQNTVSVQLGYNSL